MLGWRIAISAVLIPVLLGLFYLDHHSGAGAVWLLGLVVVLALRGAWELAQLLETRSFRPAWWLAGLCAAGVAAASWISPPAGVPAAAELRLDTLGPLGGMVTASVLVLLLSGMVRYREPGSSTETLGSELLIVCYAGLLLGVTAQLRWVAGAEAGYLVLGSVVICAKCGDIGGYAIGRLFGRTKLVPRLSPGKTRAGGVGALAAAAVAGWTWLQFATPRFGSGWQPPEAGWSLLYGGLIGLAGLVGDLAESLLKRDLEAKDSAALFPGFGGLLDLLDSILFAGPVAWLLWQVFPLITWR